MAHTPLEVSRLAADRLAREGVADARLDAELLLSAVLGLRRLDLYLQHDRPLTEDEVARYREALRRRLRREPLQYIVGEVDFRELTLKVDARALIPRPETEVLVGEVLARAPEHATALDIGTGTGAIALSLLREGEFRRVVATDTSAQALELAAENARRLRLDERLDLRLGSLFEPLRSGERFDIVVSNPPYVPVSDRAALQPEVGQWEPAEALFAAGDGTALLDAIIKQAPFWLQSGGLLALEVGAGQAGVVAERIRVAGVYDAPRTARDLAGHERIVLATLRIAQPEGKSEDA